jgi:hypothetical protein
MIVPLVSGFRLYRSGSLRRWPGSGLDVVDEAEHSDEEDDEGDELEP